MNYQPLAQQGFGILGKLDAIDLRDSLMGMVAFRGTSLTGSLTFHRRIFGTPAWSTS